MASSQVETVSSSPFRSVLRDRNHREACRESNVKCTHHHHHHATLQRNIKNFVMDLNTCMVVSSDCTKKENDDNDNNKKNEGNNRRKAPKNNRLERLGFTRANSFKNSSGNDTSLASLISPRHSRLLDRWAAKQAREMVSNLENEAELLSMDDCDMFPRTSSSTSEEESTSSEIPNKVASSLVQIWEKRLNQSGVSKTITSGEKIVSTSSPPNENVNAPAAEEECFDGPSGNDEGSSFPSSFHEWESSDHSVSPRGRSESGVSVANIIKKLTSTNLNQSPTPSFADENDHEGYASSSLASSPCRERECGHQQQSLEHKLTCPLRIRGRQAFNDLLMQMENDRRRELNNLAERGAVSKFAQRGRIQALLRIKLLQRDLSANDRYRQKSASSEVNNRQPQGSAIMQLRERFSIGVELRTPVQVEVANPRSSQRKTVNKKTQLGNAATTDQRRKDTRNQTAQSSANHATESTQKSVSQTRIDHTTEEAPPCSNVMVQETRPPSDAEALHNKSEDTSETTTSTIDPNLNETTDTAETSNQQNAMTKSSNDETVNEEETSNQNYAESSYDDEMEEDEEEIDQNCDDQTNNDWISEISKPKSYWEERRQAWYREMLETGSHNEDIRRLLERKTVSSFLSSDFRDKMNRLMESHKGTQAHLVNCQDLEEDSQGLMAFLQERLHSARTSREDGRDVIEEEEERSQEEDDNADEHEEEHEREEESLISGSYHEVGDYSNMSSSWSYRDNEAGYDFDRAVSTSPQTYHSQSFYQDSRNSPSTNHHSMEMELIYDLKGHMEQLYQEMSALRKIIKGCMDMQVELQQTMKQEVHSGLCGHMCACLKCAMDLQCNSGKCPICRAKIVDVVRVGPKTAMKSANSGKCYPMCSFGVSVEDHEGSHSQSLSDPKAARSKYANQPHKGVKADIINAVTTRWKHNRG
ncbi:unnamed protein product [Sphenostylis stenocarpa]|uniref:RING-type domain-containing protein n=1 Tax=Sphenostylis stenocarpa TaxID=92480 RepID=A0AA86T310_9FABA|nr:unnamed protein product [Sphenostylis stenocarpa]